MRQLLAWSRRAITTAPEMHRYLVDQQHWLSDFQFNDSIAIAQAAPGPNILFVALLGWNIGMNAGGFATALLGALITMTGILLPSNAYRLYTAQNSLARQLLDRFPAPLPEAGLLALMLVAQTRLAQKEGTKSSPLTG